MEVYSIPSGYLTVRHGKSPFLSSVNHLFRLGPSIPWLCLNNQMVNILGKSWSMGAQHQGSHPIIPWRCTTSADAPCGSCHVLRSTADAHGEALCGAPGETEDGC